MSNKRVESKHENNEVTIWELLCLLRKNWLLIVLVFVIIVGIAVFYSFVIQEQGVVSYKIKQTVIYDEWEYYPPLTASLESYINDALGEDYISSISIKDNNSEDEKAEYELTVAFDPGVSEKQVETISEMIATWHNEMMETEMKRILTNKENEQNELYLNYLNAEKEYSSFMTENPVSSEIVNPAEDILNSQKEIALELWKQNIAETNDLEYRFNNAEYYYIHDFAVSSTVENTWKVNIIMAVLLSFVLSVIYILMRESYMSYKKGEGKV